MSTANDSQKDYQHLKYLVSSAFKTLFRGCCSKQLTAGLPASGIVIALNTKEVMA